MANLTVSLSMHRRWWFPAALVVAYTLLWLGLISGPLSP
jgi:hypothetical protein